VCHPDSAPHAGAHDGGLLVAAHQEDEPQALLLRDLGAVVGEDPAELVQVHLELLVVLGLVVEEDRLALLGAVGDVSPPVPDAPTVAEEELGIEAGQHVGGAPGGRVAIVHLAVELDHLPRARPGRAELVDIPGSLALGLVLADLGPGRGDPAAVEVLAAHVGVAVDVRLGVVGAHLELVGAEHSRAGLHADGADHPGGGGLVEVSLALNGQDGQGDDFALVVAPRGQAVERGAHGRPGGAAEDDLPGLLLDGEAIHPVDLEFGGPVLAVPRAGDQHVGGGGLVGVRPAGLHAPPPRVGQVADRPVAVVGVGHQAEMRGGKAVPVILLVPRELVDRHADDVQPRLRQRGDQRILRRLLVQRRQLAPEGLDGGVAGSVLLQLLDVLLPFVAVRFDKPEGPLRKQKLSR